MNKPDSKQQNPRTAKPFGRAMTLLGLTICLLVTDSGFGGESAATEYQVKALFIFNFAKYVDWPAAGV
jgi:hypothetical protein